MRKTPTLITLLGWCLLSGATAQAAESYTQNNNNPNNVQYPSPAELPSDDIEIKDLPEERDDPDAYRPRYYVPGEKKGIQRDLQRSSSDQLLLKDREDSITRKEKNEGPSAPAKPNKGGGQ